LPADVGVSVPEEMETLAAPAVDQLSTLLAPGAMVGSLAAKLEIVGIEPSPVTQTGDPHPATVRQINRERTEAQPCARVE